MNDQHIDDLFDQTIPAADENARKKAINSAGSEFSQAFQSKARPISEHGQSARQFFTTFFTKIGSFFMNNPNKPRVSNTFATVAVAFVAVSVFFMLPEQRGDMQPTPKLTEATIIEPTVKTTIVKQADSSDADKNIDSSTQTSPSAPVTNQNSGNDSLISVIEPQQSAKDVQQTINGGKQTLVASDSDTKTALKSTSSDEIRTNRTIVLRADRPSTNAPTSPSVISTARESIENEYSTKGERVANDNRPAFSELKSVTIPTPPATSNQSSSVAENHVVEEIYITAQRKKSQRIGPRGKRKNAQASGKQLRDHGLIASFPKVSQSMRNEPTGLPTPRPDLNEDYAKFKKSSIIQVSQQPVSTFSVDVDTASYALVRNQLNRGLLPRVNAVRPEEMINYFNYDYPTPSSAKQAFQPSISVLDSPWNKGKKLVHIGIQGYQLAADSQPDSNIVFLLDVSGSMNSANKLPLVKQSVGLLLDTLKPSDTISIVVYAGAAGTVLKPTKVSEKAVILAALNRLSAGGSTAGGAGIELAYDLAEQNFNKDAVNRIILATDGDFNVGLSSNTALKTLVERKRDKGIFLSVLGFGRNNYQDDMMQTLAQNGNGVAAYIDTLSEAKKVLVDQATSMLFTIAKDVKLQVEFNPATVSEYRLIGYETRALKREDFNNDKVDAGDIGSGHRVTAIYEITPQDSKAKSIDTPRYSANRTDVVADKKASEYGFLKIRYKAPKGSKSKLLEYPIAAQNSDGDLSEAQFSIAVAGFAQLLSGSKYTGDWSYDDVIKLAQKHKGDDAFGYRSEFVQLVRMAKIAKP